MQAYRPKILREMNKLLDTEPFAVLAADPAYSLIAIKVRNHALTTSLTSATHIHPETLHPAAPKKRSILFLSLIASHTTTNYFEI